MSGWQPIATAPKDGTMVDLWLRRIAKAHIELVVNGVRCREHGFRVTNARWCGTGRVGEEGWTVWVEDDSELVEEEDLCVVQVVTHWMPVPEPPPGSKIAACLQQA